MCPQMSFCVNVATPRGTLFPYHMIFVEYELQTRLQRQNLLRGSKWGSHGSILSCLWGYVNHCLYIALFLLAIVVSILLQFKALVTPLAFSVFH